jgi:hypothetical protein
MCIFGRISMVYVYGTPILDKAEEDFFLHLNW